jgi:hypothetical protein
MVENANVVEFYPTEVWYERHWTGEIHIKMQHMAPDTYPFTFITIDYDYAYTSNGHQRAMAEQIGKLLGVENISERDAVGV